MIDDRTYRWLFVLVGITYLTGLFITPLMENDAVQHASVAMRMYLEGDYINIINRFQDYLDKPHLLFWLGGLSYKIFGISDWAYRLPSVIVTFAGAYATFRLGRLLYDQNTGKLAALIFLTTQATILGNHDVRMDALLTGFVIIATWQFAEFIQSNKMKNMIFGAIAIGLGFSTKGQIAVFIVGVALLSHVIYQRKWDIFWNWKWLVGLMVFLLTSFPMLYAYYHQFDLHPEKLVNGRYNVSGIKFIFWEQSFERLAGDRNMVENSDYFFFYHSFLWAFLPWSALAIGAVVYQLKKVVFIRFRKEDHIELLTLGGALITFSIISFASFKLPHYINVLFPFFALLTAYYLQTLYVNNKSKLLRAFLIVQYVVSTAILVLLMLLNFWSFPIDNWYWGMLYLVLFTIVVFAIVRPYEVPRKIIVVSVVVITFANIVLNTNFYPKLIKYQSGSELAYVVNRQGIPANRIYCFDSYSKSLDFYTRRITPPITLDEIREKKEEEPIWVFTYQSGMEKLKQEGIEWDNMFRAEHYTVTTLKANFVNPLTRPQSLSYAYLLEIR